MSLIPHLAVPVTVVTDETCSSSMHTLADIKKCAAVKTTFSSAVYCFHVITFIYIYHFMDVDKWILVDCV